MFRDGQWIGEIGDPGDGHQAPNDRIAIAEVVTRGAFGEILKAFADSGLAFVDVGLTVDDVVLPAEGHLVVVQGTFGEAVEAGLPIGTAQGHASFEVVDEGEDGEAFGIGQGLGDVGQSAGPIDLSILADVGIQDVLYGHVPTSRGHRHQDGFAKIDTDDAQVYLDKEGSQTFGNFVVVRDYQTGGLITWGTRSNGFGGFLFCHNG